MTVADETPWRTRRLDDLLAYEQPSRYLVRSTNYALRGRYPVLTAGKTFVLGYTNETDGAYTRHPVVIFDDFTTASKYVDFDFKAKSSAMKMLTARPGEADLRFVYERMQLINYPIFDHKRRWIAEFSKLEVEVPELEEQTAIAQVAEELSRYIASLERLIAKKQAMKQGMMQELLTGRTRLAGFSDPWGEVRLGDHVTYVKTVPLSREQLDLESPLRYLHYGDVHTRLGLFLDAAVEAMPRASATLASRAGRLKVGDLVFADASEDAAGVGRSLEVTSVPKDGVVAGLHTIAARFDKSVLADGFKAYLQFIPSFRQGLLRLAAGTKVLATTRSYISSVELQLPSIPEQRAIAGGLTDCELELSALRLRRNKACAIKEGMMQELLTGQTRLPVTQAVA